MYLNFKNMIKIRKKRTFFSLTFSTHSEELIVSVHFNSQFMHNMNYMALILKRSFKIQETKVHSNVALVIYIYVTFMKNFETLYFSTRTLMKDVDWLNLIIYQLSVNLTQRHLRLYSLLMLIYKKIFVKIMSASLLTHSLPSCPEFSKSAV